MSNKTVFIVFLLLCCFIITTCEWKLEKVMKVSTGAISDTTYNSASASGQIIDMGEGATEYGHYYGKTSGRSFKTVKGAPTGSGSFTSKLENLEAGTEYSVKAYIRNEIETVYGEEIKFKTDPATIEDVDGNVYNIIRIGTQLWMKENLKTTKYRNGDLIGTTTPSTKDISGESTPKYQWAYVGNESNVVTYGRLYTWYAAIDSRGVCPTGWRVPSDVEWATLQNYLIANGYNYDGSTTDNKIAKSLASASGWTSSTITGAVGNTDYPEKRNSTGFTAFPGGFRGSVVFGNIVIGCYLWSVTEYDAMTAWDRSWGYESSEVRRRNSNNKVEGKSVRCLRN